MSAPISFPLWLLLVAMIGTPIHVFLSQRHVQTRFNYAIFSSLTIALTMLICFAFGSPGGKHGFHDIVDNVGLALSFGLIFGVPLGLIFRGVVLTDSSSE